MQTPAILLLFFILPPRATAQVCNKPCCQDNNTPYPSRRPATAYSNPDVAKPASTQLGPAAPSAPQRTSSESGSSPGKGLGKHHGEITYFNIGQGACGSDFQGQDETVNILALSHLLMGTLSNNNPYCGKTAMIRANGREATAIVQDKCMDCAIDNIDVSRKVFRELFDSLDRGRAEVEWWFEN